MYKLLCWLVLGRDPLPPVPECEHVWALDNKYEILKFGKNIGEAHYCHCKKCGLPKVFNLHIASR